MFAAYSWETTSYGKAVSQSICMFRAARPGFPFSQDHYLHPLPSHQLDCPSSRSPESSWLESQPMGYSQEMGEISAGSTEQLPIHSERRNERNSWSSWIIHDRGLLDYLSIISFDTCAYSLLLSAKCGKKCSSFETADCLAPPLSNAQTNCKVFP